MNENELLAEFLTHWPESYHRYDEIRFVKWAIAAHRQGRKFPMSEFENAGLSERALHYYQTAFSFVGYTLDVLDEGI